MKNLAQTYENLAKTHEILQEVLQKIQNGYPMSAERARIQSLKGKATEIDCALRDIQDKTYKTNNIMWEYHNELRDILRDI